MMQKYDQDEWLMAQVRQGKREQLDVLIRRHATPVLTFLRRMVGDPHKSEELFQETFLAVWRKRDQYEFPRPFKAWVYAIALNQCRAHFRRRYLSFEADVTALPEDVGPGPSEAAIATETAALVGAAVARLPAQQRAIVMLRIWEGLSYEEIAEAVGRSEGTVRSNMHHGLAALRSFLEPRLK
ncbi:MAG: RNA polymerase sigma factor [Gemmataceae bacterium]